MSRPKPKIIFEVTDKTYKSEQVLEANSIYAVCLDGQPINLRTVHKLKVTTNGQPMAKYKKCSFSNPGHAFNLAERLNELFNTDRFAVHIMVVGGKIEEK